MSTGSTRIKPEQSPTRAQLGIDQDFAAINSRIDDLESASNVKDVVATNAALQSYDTATLAPNDIIIVLVDETQNNLKTYWRWAVPNPGWNYVDSLPPPAIATAAPILGTGTPSNPVKLDPNFSSGLPDAPADGALYARKNNAWAPIYIPLPANLPPVASGLVQYLDAINNTGTGHSAAAPLWFDLSGNNNHGTLRNFTGSPWGADYLPFNGANQDILTELYLNTLGISFTMIAAVQMDSSANYKGIAGEHYTYTAQNQGVVFGQWENNIITFNIFGDNSNYTKATFTTSQVPLNTKQTLGMVIANGDTGVVYKNGSLLANMTRTGAIIPALTIQKMLIGRADRQNPNRYLQGNVHAFLVYNRALSANEIAQVHDYLKARFAIP